jgi:hypothetical protein
MGIRATTKPRDRPSIRKMGRQMKEALVIVFVLSVFYSAIAMLAVHYIERTTKYND